MALQASVGSECVTGVMTPMTPNGAYSCSAMPFSPLKASVRRNSTPGMRSATTFSFSILCSSRPIFVSSSSSRPSVSACSMQIWRMQSMALRRSSRPRARTRCWASAAAATALVDVVEDAAVRGLAVAGRPLALAVAHAATALAAPRCGSVRR